MNNISAISQVSPTDRIKAALATAVDYLSLEQGLVSQVSGDHYPVVSVHGVPHNKLAAGSLINTHLTLCAQALEQQGLVAVHDLSKSPYGQQSSQLTFCPPTYIGVPIRVNGGIFGTLCFSAQQPQEEPFKETEKQFIRLLAKWVATTLELKAQHDTLERSESRLRGLFELAPVGIALSDFETGAFIDFNPALLTPTGYSRDTFMAMGLLDLINEDKTTVGQQLFTQSYRQIWPLRASI
ncbi:GAF domain-containing protein [Aliidiomarina maris]|uniref:GAF domain-containing protein n=1 Tax=Aliidiomarina maris TaxID=531312 RepID=UPI0031455E9D